MFLAAVNACKYLNHQSNDYRYSRNIIPAFNNITLCKRKTDTELNIKFKINGKIGQKKIKENQNIEIEIKEKDSNLMKEFQRKYC